MRFFGLMAGVSGLIVVGLDARPARAGVGTELAAIGCAAATSSMLSTQVAVDPHHLTFYAVTGDEPPPSQAIAVQCFDYGDYYGDCGGNISVNQPWLETDRGSFYGVDRVEVWVDATDLEPGVYEGKIHVSYYFIAIDDEEDVSVELVVEEPVDDVEAEGPPEDIPEDR